MKTNIYNITGMSCAACSASVNKVVSRLDGVTECDVNLLTGKMTVTFDTARLSEEDIFCVVKKAGFGIYAQKAEKPKSKDQNSVYPIVISAVFTAVLLVISMGTMLFEEFKLPSIISPDKNPYNFALTQLILCIPALYFGRKFFSKGLPLLFRRRPNMDSLVALGALASLVYSIVVTYTISYNPHAVHSLYYESVAVVITLVMLGKFLEDKSKNKTLDAIKKLMELAPETAIVRRDEREATIPIKEVEVGDVVVVKAGDKIPLDGVIISGETFLDESMLTGESMPVEKSTGDVVTGGTLNLTGYILVKVTRCGEDTTISKIIKFVEEASSKKAPIAATADKVAGIFVPIVIVIAFVSAVIWLMVGKEISFSLKIFTSVLVVACPCSLGLATPTAIMVGTGLGAAKGIFIRNGKVLQTTYKVKTVVFDKTGTLTIGSPKVTDVVASDEKRLLIAVNYGELASTHPIAKAILEYNSQKGITTETAEKVVTFSGMGMSCTVSGKKILIGNKELLEKNGIAVEDDKVQQLASQGKSLVFVAEDGEYLGLIAVADSLKPTSKEAVLKLKKLGIRSIMLSGDSRLCAQYIANEIGVDEVYAEVLPTQKAEIIEKIRLKYGAVLMMGDGINDAPALAQADVGCACENGSDIAIESADIVLMKNDPADVSSAINLSRYTIKNIKQNLFWAFCYNVVCIPVAAGLLYPFVEILLSPMLAGLAMSLSSVFVVGNALRLRFKKL